MIQGACVLLAATMIDLQRDRFAQQQQAIHEGDQEAQPFDENFSCLQQQH